LLLFSEENGVLRFKVRVVPRASHPGVAGEHDGALRVRVSAAPVDGAANEELIRILADVLRVPRRNIEITSGQTSKEKQIRVTGSTGFTLDSLINAAGAVKRSGTR